MRAVGKGRRALEVSAISQQPSASAPGWQGEGPGKGEGSGRGIREGGMGMCTENMGVCVCVCICMSMSVDAGVGVNVDVNVDAGAEGTCMDVCARGQSLHGCDGLTGPATRARRTRTVRRRRPMTNERTAPRSRVDRDSARSTCHTKSEADLEEEGAAPRFPHYLHRRRRARR